MNFVLSRSRAGGGISGRMVWLLGCLRDDVMVMPSVPKLSGSGSESIQKSTSPLAT